MKRALVTGATGLVGSHIVERLLADGWEVRGLARTPSAPDALDMQAIGMEPVQGDVLDGERFTQAATGVDVIFHTAAVITRSGGWETYRRLNVDGTANAIAAAESSGARLLQLSSAAVYGPEGRYRGDGGKTDENTPLAPLPTSAFYARSKRDSEQMVMDAHRAGRIWATAVRPTVIYGRRDRQCVPRIAGMLRLGVAPLIGGGRSELSIVHAANVADGAVRAVMTEAAGGRAYNVTNDFPVTVRRFFELGAHGLGRRVHFLPVPLGVANGLFQALRVTVNAITGGKASLVTSASLGLLTQDNPFSSERARREIGWTPTVDPERGVPEAFDWWLKNHR